jgi:hypothetical protein
MTKSMGLRHSLSTLAIVLMAGTALAANAENKENFGDRVVGSSIKLMAKTYVLTADLEKLKRTHTARIDGMDDESFRFAYGRTIAVVEASPRLRNEAGLMDRRRARELIAGLDKKKLCRMVDDVPDAVIAAQFRDFMARRMDRMKGMDLTKRIQYAWSSFVKRME